MREIGGYIELDRYSKTMLHENALALNCGRNALAYLIEARNIKKISMPYFMCDSCDRVFEQYAVTVKYYHIDCKFLPVNVELEEEEWLYIVNFYGQINNDILEGLKKNFKYIIVDNTQSYFQMPLEGVDTLYSCRKYFGVPDGAFLYSDSYLDRELLVDESFERMHFLLGRFERSANEFYSEYVENNELFYYVPIKQMSRLTWNLLHGIDYEEVAQTRTDNFLYLHNVFAKQNKLQLDVPYGAFMYPLYVKDADEIRNELQKIKIYIPILWPNVLEGCDRDAIEYNLSKNILPLPIDQRYGREEMKYMEDVIRKYID